MGHFTYGTDPISIGATTNIVLERLRVRPGDVEDFRLHTNVTYADTTSGRSFTVPPEGGGDFTTDLASVPQLLTWLVPKSGLHLPAALVHDHLVDDDSVEPHHADRIFRDAMGDLGVGFVRRWVMWTAVAIKTIVKRGTFVQRAGAVATLAVIVVLGVLATWNLFTARTILPWMGDRAWWAEVVFGLAGAVVIPIVLGLLLWNPVRIAGVIAGISVAVLLHAMVLIGAVYGVYLLIERLKRPLQVALAAAVVVAATVLFGYALATA